jgi:hypothetical protein
MLLDLIDNLGRCRFSSGQMRIILMLMRKLGVVSAPTYSQFRTIQSKLQSKCGSAPKKHVSQFGNRFYLNDIRETIARVSTLCYLTFSHALILTAF